MNSNLLVSVVVVAYNSSAFILETLDSIRAQTYGNIELIIADDGSSDDTIRICQAWIDRTRYRFARTVLLSDGVNLGISGNCNRGLAQATGDWIKFIAGDDTLLANCLSDNVRFAIANEGVAVVFSDMFRMSAASDILDTLRLHKSFFRYDGKMQLFYLLHHGSLPAVTAFMRKGAIEQAGGFDTAYPMMEDYPLWIKLLRTRQRFGYLENVTACYRLHSQSVSNDIEHLNPVFTKCRMDYDRQVRLPLARSISHYLYVKVWIDAQYFRLLIRRPRLFRCVYPLAWLWMKIQYIVNQFAFPDNRDLVA